MKKVIFTVAFVALVGVTRLNAVVEPVIPASPVHTENVIQDKKVMEDKVIQDKDSLMHDHEDMMKDVKTGTDIKILDAK